MTLRTRERPLHAQHRVNPSGFTLLEVLVSTALLCGALTTAAQLLIMGTKATTVARHTTLQTIFAAHKVEELRSVDAAALPPSSPDGWVRAGSGGVEYLARDGVVLGIAGTPPAGTTYVRRWSVTPLAGVAGAMVVSVSVDGLRSNAAGDGVADASPWSASRAIGVSTLRGGS